MKLIRNTITALAATSAVSLQALAFSPSNNSIQPTTQLEAAAKTRGDFLATAAAAVASTALVTPIQPAYARGRATLEAAYDRYAPRIIEGGAFYKSQLYGAIRGAIGNPSREQLRSHPRNRRRISCCKMEESPNVQPWQEGLVIAKC